MAEQRIQNEAALVCAARGGDKHALQTLLRQNWGWLKGLAYSVVGSSQDLDDVMQEICVRVISKIETVREPERFGAWLAVLARNTAMRYSQRRAQSPVVADTEEVSRRVAGHVGTPLDEIEQKETCRRVLDAVKALPDKYREAFMLQHSSGLTYAQIAEILDIPITTVQIRLVRARRMVLERLKGREKVQER